MHTEDILDDWPEDSKNVADNVIVKYGEPDEVTDSMLIWHNNGEWKRTIVYREPIQHDWPMKHTDIVEMFVDYHVPAEKYDELAEFDGSVTAYRTRGEISAMCHDEEANRLALNLAVDIIKGDKSVRQARDYYQQSILDFRRKKPTPYMEKLHFEPGTDTEFTDNTVLTKGMLEQAKAEGKQHAET